MGHTAIHIAMYAYWRTSSNIGYNTHAYPTDMQMASRTSKNLSISVCAQMERLKFCLGYQPGWNEDACSQCMRISSHALILTGNT